jgi:tetratricopeptide (TPR) repeat protein
MTDRHDPKKPSRSEKEDASGQKGEADLRGYEEAIRLGSGRIAARAAEILDEIDRVAALLDELLAQSAPERRRFVEEQLRFRVFLLSELLLERCRAAFFSDPAGAVELAELAVVVTDRLDTGHYGETLAEDARARAWAHLANARRINSDLRGADEALQTAEEHHVRAGEDAYTGAEILSFKASLLNARGLYFEAAAVLDPVVEVYREAKDRHLEGRALIKKATSLSYAGQHAEAARLVRRGLARIDVFEEPRLVIAGRHNLIASLRGSGKPDEALQALDETRGLYLQLGERQPLLRLRWLEGKILRDLGKREAAEAAFLEVRDELVERKLGLDAALASLDLAMIYLERGETAELKRLAAEMIPVFESRDDQQKAMAAFLLFRQAAEAEQVTAALLHEVASSLEQVRRSTERL